MTPAYARLVAAIAEAKADYLTEYAATRDEAERKAALYVLVERPTSGGSVLYLEPRP